jgi:UDP-glucose 4-epimerase
MRILITGGYGYLGSRIADFFLKNTNHEIVIASRRNKPISNDIEFVNINWKEIESIKKCCLNIDVILHLAGMNAQECQENPGLAHQINTVNSANLFLSAQEMKVKKFVYFSTIHVYGDPLNGIIDEDSLTKPNHPYSISKYNSEIRLQQLIKESKIKLIVIRLSNSFGSPIYLNSNCWMLLMNDIAKQIILNKQIVLNSDGKQRRDFISINNVCRAVNHLVNTDLGNSVFNLGGEWTPTINEIATTMQSLSKKYVGNHPKIKRIYTNTNSKSVKFSFKIDRIKKTGFHLKNNNLNEIENLISKAFLFFN